MKRSLETPPSPPAPCLPYSYNPSILQIPYFQISSVSSLYFDVSHSFSLDPFVPFSLYFLLNLLRVNRDYSLPHLNIFTLL